jgi:hypothetical protein
MFLAVFVVAVVLWFFKPIASINSATCARIQPGMTEEQAHDIVGAPPGWYDGVGGIRTDAPAYKGYKPSWVGLRGEIVVDLDESGRVEQAAFYSGEILGWSPINCLWERFTRVKYLRLTVLSRTCLHLALSGIAIFMLGIVVIRVDRRNTITLHGLIGLVIGAILAVAIFSEGFFSDLILTALTLAGPILGALAGIVAGFGRGVLTKRWVAQVAVQPGAKPRG